MTGPTSAGSCSESDGSGGGSTGPTVDCGNYSRIAFLNFDGPVLSGGPDSAIDNVVDEPSSVGPRQPYPDDDRAEITSMVRDHFAGFDVCVVDSRPPSNSPPYDMIVLTKQPHPNGIGVVSTADTDCGDQAGAGSVTVVWLGAAELDTELRAVATSRALGMSYGLELLEADPTDIMTTSLLGAEAATFSDVCLVLLDLGMCMPSSCGAGLQSSVAHLATVLGPSP